MKKAIEVKKNPVKKNIAKIFRKSCLLTFIRHIDIGKTKNDNFFSKSLKIPCELMSYKKPVNIKK
jgi:hypothetical protein